MLAHNKIYRASVLALAIGSTSLALAEDTSPVPVTVETPAIIAVDAAQEPTGTVSAPAVTANASYEAPAAVLTTPQQDRITDQVITADLNGMKGLQDRIAKLNANGVNADNYYLVKAQAWLDFAMHEYYENDRSLVIEHALAESAELIRQLEAANSNITMDTTVIAESQRLREDLWAISAKLKQHRGFRCAAAALAELEVRLVWAGHENKEMGWRHAREPIGAAERLAQQAQIQVEHCDETSEAQKPCPVLEPVKEAPICQAPTPGKPFSQTVLVPEAGPTPIALVNVPRNVHFGLDKSDINEKANIILNRVAEIMAAYPKMKILLIGHTDSRASQAYNQALSERRAKSVLKFLLSKGVAADRMDIRGEGFNNTLADADENMGHALSRRVEVAYLGENIQSYDQTGDLVLEEVRKKAAAAKAAAVKAAKGKKGKAAAKRAKKK